MGRRPLGPASFTMKTYSPKPEHIERRWYVMDAGDQVLGRVASEAAVILRGKHKPIFAPHMDVGDHLIFMDDGKIVEQGDPVEVLDHPKTERTQRFLRRTLQLADSLEELTIDEGGVE